MKTTEEYKGFVIETITKESGEMESIAFKNGEPIVAAASHLITERQPLNSVEKVKAKIDARV